ncbi:MAG: uroporphyrinogen decarboxylase family protein [Thermoleophilia bacterium]
MNGKERFSAVLEGSLPDRVPVAPPFQGYWALDAFGVTVPQSLADPVAAAQAALAAQEACPFDALEVVWDWVANIDLLGCTSKIVDAGSPLVVEHVLESSVDVAKLRSLDLTADGRVEAGVRTAEVLLEQLSRDFFCYATIPLPFTLASYLRKVDYLMKDLIRQPAVAQELLEFATEVIIEVAKLYASLGVHGLFICDPSASGDLISPRHFEEFAAPYARRVIETVKAMGLKQIVHVCGDTTQILPLIRDLSPSAFSFDTAVDVGVAKEALGDVVCLMGNVDPSDTLLLGTRDKVRRETELCIEKGRDGGRFVVAAGCDIGVETPIENISTMIDACAQARY